MTESFTASNGAIIHRTSAGALAIGNYLFFSPGEEEGLREFFQHGRDEELGRWRWPAEPDWVAREGDRSPHDGRTVILVNERTLERCHYNERVRRGDAELTTAKQAARAFFEAHPERKPWHDAKPGEVWVLDIEGAGYAAVREYGADFKLSNTNLISPRDERVVAGRRIWPEDAS